MRRYTWSLVTGAACAALAARSGFAQPVPRRGVDAGAAPRAAADAGAATATTTTAGDAGATTVTPAGATTTTTNTAAGTAPVAGESGATTTTTTTAASTDAATNRVAALEARLRELEARVNAQQQQQQQPAAARGAVPPAPPGAPVAAPPGMATVNAPPGWMPTAGWSNNGFYIQSRDGLFVLMPSARMQIDGYAYAPPMEGRDQPHATIFLRRLRPELIGSLFNRRIDFMIAGDLATFANGSAATDAFVTFNLHDWAHIQVGQYDIPFTIENRTSDRYIDWMERSFTVRNFGTPNKEPGVMVWGGPANFLFYYSLGLFNGDGMNVRNLDNAFNVVGRAFVRPLAFMPNSLLARAQVGGSVSIENHRNLNQPINNGNWFQTESGYGFFRTTYQGGVAPARVQADVVPEGTLQRYAAEINLPIGPFSLRSEFIYLRGDTAENQLASGAAERAGGEVSGFSGYVQAGLWVLGNPNVLPDPGIEAMPRLDPAVQVPRPTYNLQLLVRGEYAAATYRPGNAVPGAQDIGPSMLGGDYQYWSLGFGANFWWTRHVRFTLNYILNHMDGPNAALPAMGQNYVHEFGARVGLAL